MGNLDGRLRNRRSSGIAGLAWKRYAGTETNRQFEKVGNKNRLRRRGFLAGNNRQTGGKLILSGYAFTQGVVQGAREIC